MSDGCRQGKEEGVWKKINTGFLSYKPRKLLERTRFENLGWNEKALGSTRRDLQDALKYLVCILS